MPARLASVPIRPSTYSVAVGDSSPANEQIANHPDIKPAQDLKTLLGKMLRLDIDKRQDGKGYGYPNDNPFAEAGTKPGQGLPEIYAWGLRNPWSFSFDSKLSKARLKAGPHLSGVLTYTATKLPEGAREGEGKVGGNLAVDFPGHAGVAIGGPGFTATIVHGERSFSGG